MGTAGQVSPKGFGGRARQKVRQRAEEFIASAAVPHEPIVAGALMISGLDRKWVLLTPYIRLFGRSYYLALTEHYVLFCLMSGRTGRPVEVRIVAPRDQVRITNVRLVLALSGGMGSMLCYVPGRSAPMTLRFYRIWRSEVEYLLGQLGIH
jgi:hypothetical protein